MLKKSIRLALMIKYALHCSPVVFRLLYIFLSVVGFVVKEKGDECQALSPNPIPGEFIVGSDSIKLSISKKSLNTALLWQL